MTFRLIECAPAEGHYWVSSYDAVKGVDSGYSKGAPLRIRGAAAELKLSTESSIETDLLSGVFSYPVVSERLRSTISRYEPENCQFFPVRVVKGDGSPTETPYYFMNVLDNRACFDWGASTYEEGRNRKMPLDVTRLVVLESEIEDRHLVRIREIPSLMLVSKALQSEIESSNMLGVQFLPVSDYDEFTYLS
ncbi:MAG: DUF1629 domain-containing protein [Pseudomonadota bacterium]